MGARLKAARTSREVSNAPSSKNGDDAATQNGIRSKPIPLRHNPPDFRIDGVRKRGKGEHRANPHGLTVDAAVPSVHPRPQTSVDTTVAPQVRLNTSVAPEVWVDSALTSQSGLDSLPVFSMAPDVKQENFPTLPVAPHSRLDATAKYFDRERQFQLPATYQPSRIYQFQELFINHFIDFYFPELKSEHNSWVHNLPKLLNGSPSPSVRFSIRAATMAIYGKLTQDESIQFESCRWYIRGLQIQRAQLQVLCSSGQSVVDASMVFVPLLFCHFETSMCTAPDAWMPHAVAAENILVMMGPYACRTSQMHTIFLSVRLAAVNNPILYPLRIRLMGRSFMCQPPLTDSLSLHPTNGVLSHSSPKAPQHLTS